MSRGPLWSVWPILWPQKLTGSEEVDVTYFMTTKDRVTFVVGLSKIMTQKGHGVKEAAVTSILTPKGQGDLCGRFDQVYDPKQSRGH